MRFLFFFCITVMISGGSLLVALTMSKPWPLYAVGFGIWILFFLWLSKEDRERSRRREREELFDEWLRSQNRGGRHY